MVPSIHIGKEIKNHLVFQKRSVAWLAKQLYCDASNLRKMLKNPHFPTDLLYQISIILGKDFFAYYSQLLNQKNNG